MSYSKTQQQKIVSSAQQKADKWVGRRPNESAMINQFKTGMQMVDGTAKQIQSVNTIKKNAPSHAPARRADKR